MKNSFSTQEIGSNFFDRLQILLTFQLDKYLQAPDLAKISLVAKLYGAVHKVYISLSKRNIYCLSFEEFLKQVQEKDPMVFRLLQQNRTDDQIQDDLVFKAYHHIPKDLKELEVFQKNIHEDKN